MTRFDIEASFRAEGLDGDELVQWLDTVSDTLKATHELTDLMIMTCAPDSFVVAHTVTVGPDSNVESIVAWGLGVLRDVFHDHGAGTPNWPASAAEALANGVRIEFIGASQRVLATA